MTFISRTHLVFFAAALAVGHQSVKVSAAPAASNAATSNATKSKAATTIASSREVVSSVANAPSQRARISAKMRVAPRRFDAPNATLRTVSTSFADTRTVSAKTVSSAQKTPRADVVAASSSTRSENTRAANTRAENTRVAAPKTDETSLLPPVRIASAPAVSHESVQKFLAINASARNDSFSNSAASISANVSLPGDPGSVSPAKTPLSGKPLSGKPLSGKPLSGKPLSGKQTVAENDVLKTNGAKAILPQVDSRNSNSRRTPANLSSRHKDRILLAQLEADLSRAQRGLDRADATLSRGQKQLMQMGSTLRNAMLEAGPDAKGLHPFVRVAMRYAGTPYVWGGESRQGFDCSGFIIVVMRDLGMRALPHSAAEQFNYGTPIAQPLLKPGDIVFFKNTYKQGISHVGIYLGNRRYIEAAGTGKGTIVSSLDSAHSRQHYAGARRLIRS